MIGFMISLPKVLGALLFLVAVIAFGLWGLRGLIATVVVVCTLVVMAAAVVGGMSEEGRRDE